MNPPTPCPNANDLLSDLLKLLKQTLQDNFLALYLYGSLVTGNFDPDLSDVDLLAVLPSALSPNDFERLDELHRKLVAEHPKWENRLEVAYLSAEALQTFKTERSEIAVISPGEPFNVKEAGREYLMNWYLVRERGKTLFGPPPRHYIAPVAKKEFLESVREHVSLWQDGWLDEVDTRAEQAYVVLTFCRALCALQTGKQVSKKQAATWVGEQYPQWRPFVEDAFLWRKVYPQGIDHTETLPKMLAFVQFATEQINSG